MAGVKVIIVRLLLKVDDPNIILFPCSRVKTRVVGSTASLNVTVIVVVLVIPCAPSAGDVERTVGAVVSAGPVVNTHV
jgi:hypothetical protein